MPDKTERKPPVSDAGGEKKKTGVNIHLSFNDMMNLGVRIVKSGLSVTRSLEETIDHKLDELVKKGECTQDEAAAAGEKIKAQIHQGIGRFTGRLSDGVRATLNRMNIATVDDVKSLETRLDKILNEIEQVAKKPGDAAAQKATRTARTAKAKPPAVAPKGKPPAVAPKGKPPAVAAKVKPPADAATAKPSDQAGQSADAAGQAKPSSAETPVDKTVGDAETAKSRTRSRAKPASKKPAAGSSEGRKKASRSKRAKPATP